MKGNGKRFWLILLLGFLGSFIINHSRLRPQGWEARTGVQFLLSGIPIYRLVTAIANFSFDPMSLNNVGYKRINDVARRLY